MSFLTMRRFTGAIIAVAGAALLSGCFMIPGQFKSEMELSADGNFTYSYNGEIHLLGLSQLAQMRGGPFGKGSVGTVDLDEPCYNYNWEEDIEGAANEIAAATANDEPLVEIADGAADLGDAPPSIAVGNARYDDSAEERECTAEELAERQEQNERAQDRQERQARQMAALFGGTDPTDPEAGREIASRLSRQYGWNKVEYLGDGKFNIEYRITSQMGHNFAFPMIEGMTAAQPFVYAYRRNNAVRIDAPGLAIAQSTQYPGLYAGGLNLLAFAMTVDDSGDNDTAETIALLQDIGGTFTLITDGEVLANSTDEGFERLTDGRRKMVWTVDSTTEIAPMALIEM